MIQDLPFLVSLIFMLTTLLTVLFFYQATYRSVVAMSVLLAWLALQGVLAFNGYYTVTAGAPPRFALAVIPPLLFILLLFLTARGRAWLDGLDIRVLTLLHIVRIPVELTLFRLYLYHQVPALLTFEGRNFDILSGVSAPIVYYFGFVKNKLSKGAYLAWNIVCLGLLANIVITAILSAPFSFQRFAFSQPNQAILYFPFVWLPCCIVPLVLLSHLACIRKLL
ncbi:MAG: hypothetical protein P4L51_18045 [Puia sp.]|nr:hypothetical protein [Puia sp.]